MKKRLILILMSVILLILDNTFSPFIAIRGAWPSILFVFSIAYSIINGRKEGIIIGVISGVLQDIFFFQGFGVNALVNMICCFIAGGIGDGIWREKKLIPVVTIFIATILKFFGIYIIMYFINENVDLFLDKVVEHSAQYQEKSEIDEWFKLHIEKVKEYEKENMNEFYVGSNQETITEFEKEVEEIVENVCGEEIEILFNQHLSNSEANPEKMDVLYIGAKQEVEVQSEQLVAESVQNVYREEIEVLFERHVQTEKLNPKYYEQYAYCV